MNSKKISKTLVFIALAAIVVSMSSCNRGYGCPYELEASINILSSFIK